MPIGEGDEDWPEILKALDEVGYHGWATSEVAGGGEMELREIAERMNRVLGLSSRVARRFESAHHSNRRTTGFASPRKAGSRIALHWQSQRHASWSPSM